MILPRIFLSHPLVVAEAAEIEVEKAAPGVEGFVPKDYAEGAAIQLVAASLYGVVTEALPITFLFGLRLLPRNLYMRHLLHENRERTLVVAVFFEAR